MSTTVTYKGESIAFVSNDTKTLTTQGKYLEGDITLTDVSSSAPTLQTKTVNFTPTQSAQAQTVVPDSGYDGLSEVNVSVDPIPSNYGLITYNGSIITVS